MKKIFIFALSALLIAASLATGISANRTLPLVVDNADLLTSLEETSLRSLLDDICNKQQIEIAIVTVNSTSGKSVMEYADDFYDYNGYGYGENDDGALLLIDMGGREWWITTHGAGAYYLNDYSLYQIEEAFIDDLSAGNYAGAFYTFATMCESYIASGRYENGNTSDGDYPYGGVTVYPDYGYDEPITLLDVIITSFSLVIPSLIVGFIISLIVVSIMRSGMKSVRPASGAADYMVSNTLRLRTQNDRYLYSTTVRTRREPPPSNNSRGGFGSSGGGFSSMHTGSSGRSHGGRGGRF